MPLTFAPHILSCLILIAIRGIKLILTRIFLIRFNERDIDSTWKFFLQGILGNYDNYL